MQKFFLMLVLISLPVLAAEAVLHVDVVYKAIISQYIPIEWSYSVTRPQTWPNTLIMGSSLARQSVDPYILGQELKKRGLPGDAGSIAIPSDSLSDDYFTLYRVLTTCNQCPSRLVLVITDISLKEHVLKEWSDISRARIAQYFVDDQASMEVLGKAALLDPAYARGLEDIRLQKDFRLLFMRQSIVGWAKKSLAGVFGVDRDISHPLVTTQFVSDVGYGYYPYTLRLDPVVNPRGIQIDIDNYRGFLGKYKIGGSADFFLRNILDLTKKHSVQVTIVLTPLSSYYQDAFKNEVGQFRKYIADVGKEKNVSVVDAVNLMPTKYGYYTDTNHLNLDGATVFTPYLAKHIK